MDTGKAVEKYGKVYLQILVNEGFSNTEQKYAAY